MARQARGTRSEYAVIRPLHKVHIVRIETRRLALVRHITDSESDSMNDEIALRRTEIRRSTTGRACYTLSSTTCRHTTCSAVASIFILQRTPTQMQGSSNCVINYLKVNQSLPA